MSETLASRVGRVIAGGAHALIDRIEGAAPDAMMEQALREVDQVVEEVRRELGVLAANRHLVQQQHAALQQQHEQLSAQIAQALAAAREDLARAAVARQLDVEAQVPVLERTLAEQTAKEAELGACASALLAKRREMVEALEAFRASRRAAAQAGAGGSAGTPERAGEARLDAATQAFDRIYRRETGLAPAAAGASLQQAAALRELDDMVRRHQIEERLAQLRASQG